MRETRGQARERILNFLLWWPAEQFYEKEIAVESGISKSAVNLVMKQLVKEGWVDLSERGRLNLYQANLASAKVRNYKKSLTIKKLDKLVEFLKDKADRLVLFGSAGKGEDSVLSDLDILVVSNQEVKPKNLYQYLPKDRQGQIIVKTADEFRELRQKNRVLYQVIMQGERLI